MPLDFEAFRRLFQKQVDIALRRAVTDALFSKVFKDRQVEWKKTVLPGLTKLGLVEYRDWTKFARATGSMRALKSKDIYYIRLLYWIYRSQDQHKGWPKIFDDTCLAIWGLSFDERCTQVLRTPANTPHDIESVDVERLENAVRTIFSTSNARHSDYDVSDTEITIKYGGEGRVELEIFTRKILSMDLKSGWQNKVGLGAREFVRNEMTGGLEPSSETYRDFLERIELDTNFSIFRNNVQRRRFAENVMYNLTDGNHHQSIAATILYWLYHYSNSRKYAKYIEKMIIEEI